MTGGRLKSVLLQSGMRDVPYAEEALVLPVSLPVLPVLPVLNYQPIRLLPVL